MGHPWRNQHCAIMNSMRPMSWEYIAGFFDGEGTVGKSGRVPFLQIVQMKRNNFVLRRINKFLTSQGIDNKIYQVKSRQTNFKQSRITVLRINRTDDISLFLAFVMPLLYVKRKRSEEIREYIENGNFNTRGKVLRKLEAATIDYVNGMTAVGAAKKHGTSWVSLRAHLKKQNIEVRNQSAAMKLEWSKASPEKRKKYGDHLHRYQHLGFYKGPSHASESPSNSD